MDCEYILDETLSRNYLNKLITEKAPLLNWRGPITNPLPLESAGLSCEKAVRIIQEREGHTPCYGRDRPLVRDVHDSDRCGEPGCLWKTYCEIFRRKFRKVFVSYASQDIDVARNFVAALQQYGIPFCFYDVEVEPPEGGIIEMLMGGLSTVGAVLIVKTKIYEGRFPQQIVQNVGQTSFVERPKEWREREFFLSVEDSSWMDYWHSGIFFKVIFADYERLAESAQCREALYKYDPSHYYGPQPRAQDYSEFNLSLKVVPSRVQVNPNNLVGEQVSIPFKSFQKGMELLLEELVT